MMPRRRKKFKGDPAALMQSFSKNLLGLRFMQRASKVVEDDPLDYYEGGSSDNEEDEEAGQKDISIHLDTSSIQKLKTKRKCIINPSYQFCEKLKFGRLSFKGMNSDIETIMSNKSELDTSRNDSDLEGGGGGGQKRSAEDDWDDDEDGVDDRAD